MVVERRGNDPSATLRVLLSEQDYGIFSGIYFIRRLKPSAIDFYLQLQWIDHAANDFSIFVQMLHCNVSTITFSTTIAEMLQCNVCTAKKSTFVERSRNEQCPAAKNVGTRLRDFGIFRIAMENPVQIKSVSATLNDQNPRSLSVAETNKTPHLTLFCPALAVGGGKSPGCAVVLYVAKHTRPLARHIAFFHHVVAAQLYYNVQRIY